MEDAQNTVAQEEQQLINTMASIAALLGNTLYQYGKINLGVTFSGSEEKDQEISAEYDRELDSFWKGVGDSSRKERPQTTTTVPEPADPGVQLVQFFTLLHPETRKILSTSAIYDIFMDAISRLERPGETIEEQVEGLDAVTLVCLWVITKRTYALGHANECFKIVDSLLGLMRKEDIEPLNLAKISDADYSNVAALYDIYFKKPEEKKDEAPQLVTSITEIISTDNLMLPASKPFRKQMEIAAIKGTVPINVGRNEKTPVIVKARITGANGEPITSLTPFEVNIEATIGQLIQENGKPITVTPAQVYKKYANLSPNDRVSPESIEKTAAALDKLMHTPATIEYAEQVEKYTRLKKKKDFDYNAGRLSGMLISGIRLTKYASSYHGQLVEDSFTIYDIPMFYLYSYAFSQIATIPAHLLTGKKEIPQQKGKRLVKPSGKRLASDDIDLRRYLLGQIEYQKTMKEKRDKKLLYSKKPIPKTFDAILLFETIAEGIQYDISSPKRIRILRERVYDFMVEQAKLKNIKAIQYQLKGKAYVGVKITL